MGHEKDKSNNTGSRGDLICTAAACVCIYDVRGKVEKKERG